MPYIGNSHIAGDHTNNFKVLDDISSFTAIFDGSASSVVDTTNNTIRVVEHRFIQGQRVTYTNGSGGNIGGLTTGTAYFVIFDTANTIKLATNASNAATSTAINLSAVGTGTSHTLNAAFDGINTKFKITYNGGTGARFNNATQLNIAINNVLQKPNVNSSTFTEGFAIEDNHKIVFKIAPTNQDIFWGSIIANTLTTFDISDHKIDTFTGDGSTTEFTLSHTPANNESLMVTINGVLQHPSNASTARAYTLIASIIQFTAAPGVGDEIQVRHLGFAGATTADVSGFYGRTGNVVLTSNDHITTGNINAGIVTATSFVGSFSPNVGGSNANFSGIVTAGTFKGGNIDAVDGAFSGNVTIGGTLTYEDVTNIDSVGIITARKGIVSSGVITATAFHGDGSNLTGIDATALKDPAGNVKIQAQASGAVHTGISTFQDLDVDGHTELDNVNISGVTTITSAAPELHLTDTNADSDYSLVVNGGSFRLRDETNGENRVVLYSTGVLHADTPTVVLGESTFGSSSLTKVYSGQGGIKKNALMVLNPSASVAGRGAGVAVGAIGNGDDYIGTLYATRSSAGDNRGTTILEGKDGIIIKTNAATSTKTVITAGADGNVSINNDLDVDGHTNLDNTDIVGILTVTSTTQYGGYKLSNNSSIVGELVGLSGSNDTGALALWSGGSKYIQLSAQGNSYITGGSLGIGTNNPQTIFHISDNVPTIRFTDENSTGVPDCEIGGAGGNIDISADINSEKSDSVIRFNVDGGEKVRINSDGKIGIATDTGSGLINTRHAGVNQQVLHIRADLGSSTGRSLNLFTPDTDNSTAPFRFQTGNGYLFQCDGEDVFTIAHDRTVGIGTHTVLADTKAHIYDTSTSNYRSLAIDSYATNGSTMIYKQNGSQVIAMGSGGGNNLSGSDVTHGLIRSEVATIFAVGNSEKLRINSLGNVSIGGADATPSNAAYNGSTLHLYQPNTGANGSQIKFSTGASGHTASDGAYMAFYSDNNMYCNIREAGEWIFYTSNTERLSIGYTNALRWNIENSRNLQQNNANRDEYGKLNIQAGRANSTSVNDDCTAIRITPAENRATGTGTKSCGIGFQHLNADTWPQYSGNQVWMGLSLHDTPGQERSRFEIHTNTGTAQGSQPNKLGMSIYPSGAMARPNQPMFLGMGAQGGGYPNSAYYNIKPQTIAFDTAGGHISSGTYEGGYEVPVDGIYMCIMNGLVYQLGESSFAQTRWHKNGSQYGQVIQFNGNTGNHTNHFHAVLMECSAGDDINQQIYTNQGGAYSNQWHFIVYLVG